MFCFCFVLFNRGRVQNAPCSLSMARCHVTARLRESTLPTPLTSGVKYNYYVPRCTYIYYFYSQSIYKGGLTEALLLGRDKSQAGAICPYMGMRH